MEIAVREIREQNVERASGDIKVRCPFGPWL